MEILPLSEVKARLSEIAEEVDRTHQRVHITRNGRSYVVLMAAEDLESLEATIELLSDPKALLAQPTIVGAPLRAPFEGLWRARRGEYRVRYRIDADHRHVVVLDIDHRRDACRT